MADNTNNLIIDYTARDFDTIRSMLVGIAKGKFPEWKTVGEANDFGTLLLEMYAYMGDVSNYYIDRVSSEAFLGTAIRRQSVLYIAEMLGYQPIGRQASVVELEFSLPVTAAADVVIPANTKVETASTTGDTPIYFTTDYEVTTSLSGGIRKATVTATEGSLITDELLGISDGGPNLSYELSLKGVITGSVRVTTLEGGSNSTSNQYVNWSEYGTVASTRPTASAFSTWVSETDYTNVLFGDSAAGRIPPVGAEIKASYRYGVGMAANSLSTGSIVIISNSSGLAGGLSVTNVGIPYGGSDPESIESMRFSIPRSARVGDRAISLPDFEYLTLQVPGISKAVASGQIYTAVNIRIAPTGGTTSDPILAALKADLVSHLEGKLLVGASVFIEDVVWKDCTLAIDLHVLDGFEQESVTQSAVLAIESLFSFDNLDFGTKVSLGDAYRAIMKIEGVDWVDITQMKFTGNVTPPGNLVPAFDEILRITPLVGLLGDPGYVPYGLTTTAFGGVSPVS